MPPPAPPAKSAILTCMDPRLQLPVALGDEAEDAFVLRNAGGRVTDDVLRSLVLCTRLLGVTSVGVLHHTDCRMQEYSNTELAQKTGVDIDFLAFSESKDSIEQDVVLLRSSGLIDPALRIWGGLYHVDQHAVEVVTGERQ